MVQQVGRKAYEGVRGGIGGIWEGGGRLAARLGGGTFAARRSWTDSLRSRPGLSAFLSVLAALSVVGLVLYLRKRRQVADHYTMGGDEAAAWEGGSLHGIESAEPSRL